MTDFAPGVFIHPILVSAFLGLISIGDVDPAAECAKQGPFAVKTLEYMISNVPVHAASDYAARGRSHSDLSPQDLDDAYVTSFAQWSEDIGDDRAARRLCDLGSEIYLRRTALPHDRTDRYSAAVLAGLIGRIVADPSFIPAIVEAMAASSFADLGIGEEAKTRPDDDNESFRRV